MSLFSWFYEPGTNGEVQCARGSGNVWRVSLGSVGEERVERVEE